MRFRREICMITAAALLTGCAAGRASAPAALTSALNGRYETGRVVAIRAIDATAGGTARQVLAALRSPAGPIPDDQAEVIIRQADGTVNSIVEPMGSIVNGEKVAIVEAAATVLRPE
jgi:hypothetical protein